MTTSADLLDRVNAKALARWGAQHQVNGAPVQGDFTRPGKTFTLSDGQNVTARVPTLIVADADVPVAPIGKQCVCEGVTYSIEETTPDGFGLTVFDLKKV